jgi:hypothetical protein
VSALDRTTFGPLLLAIERALWREGKEAVIVRPPDHERPTLH